MMLFLSSLRQTLRTPVRSIAVLLVAALLCALLTVGLNLRSSAEQGLDQIRGAFDVVAYPSFHGDINALGQLASPTDPDYIGYLPCAAPDYDWSPILEAPGVKDVETWGRYGAYVEQDLPLETSFGFIQLFRIVYQGQRPKLVTLEEPVTFEPGEAKVIRVEEAGAPGATITASENYTVEELAISSGYRLTWYSGVPETMAAWDSEQKYCVFDEERGWLEGIWLQPGQEYIGMGYCAPSFDPMTGKRGKTVSIRVHAGDADSVYFWQYQSDGSVGQGLQPVAKTLPCTEGFYLPLLPYDDGFWDRAEGLYFQELQKYYTVSRRTLSVAAVDDLSRLMPFYQNKVYVREGRSFSETDYDEGRKVCLVSAAMANSSGWRIGDSLYLSLFSGEFAETSDCVEAAATWYSHWETAEENGSCRPALADDFFFKGSYKIIGFYEGAVTDVVDGTSRQYTLDQGFSSTMVFVPKSSLQNAPETAPGQYRTVIVLDGEQINPFMEHMQSSGLMTPQNGGYELGLTVYDQGLSGVSRNLEQLDRVSKLTLALSAVTALLAIVLLAVLTLQQNARQIAALRSMGVPRGKVPQAVLSGLLSVCVLGACIGGFVGHRMTQTAANYILDTAQQDVGDIGFSAMLANDSRQPAWEVAIRTHPQSAVLSGAALVCLLLILTVLLVRRESGRSPILRLGAKE